MIKAKLTGSEGEPIFLLGLSEGNVRKLKENNPIMVDLKSLGGPDCKVVIMWGETEEAIRDELMKEFTVENYVDRKSGYVPKKT